MQQDELPQEIGTPVEPDVIGADGSDDGIALKADSWAVSATDKVSTGDYETHECYARLEGELPDEFESLSTSKQERLKAELRSIQRDVKDVVVEISKERQEEAFRDA